MTVRKTINKTQLQIAPSKEELAATRRMRMRQSIERMKTESRSQLAFTPKQTWQLPKPLPGVIPQNASMAMDDATSQYTGWAQNYSAFAEGQAFLGYPYLSELSQRPEYRVISETWAQEMTRKWIKLVSTGDEKIDDKTDKLKHLEDVMKTLKVQECFRKCTELDGFFGRAQIFLDLGVNKNDKDELKTTIGDGSSKSRISKVKIKKGSLKRLKVIEPVWTYPNSYNAIDPLAQDFFTPTTWYIMGQEIHASRLLTFIGRPVPDLLRPMYSFGGLSLSQMAKPYVDNWLRTRQSVSDAISNYSIMMMFTDMSAMLTEGAALDLETRADFFNVTRDNRGLMLADKNSEDIKNVSMPLGGLDHLQAQAQEHQAAVSQIPLVKLTGVSPSGLNATSEWEVKVFYDKVEAQQVAYFSEHLTKLLNIIQLSEYGEIDPEIGYEYNSLESGDDTEEATNQKTQADTDTAYMTAGVVSPQEVRTKLAANKNSPYASLDTSPEALPMPSQQEAGGETDESGNKMDAEHSDLDHSDSDGHQTQTAGSVSQGNATSNTQNKPVQSKPVAEAHDSNPNHDPKNGEFTTGSTGKMQKRTPSGERIGGEKNQPKKESSGSHNLPVDAEGKVPLVHYSSTKGIQTLDPQYYGSGASGEESKRKEQDPDNWIDRTYYGIGDTYKKESMLGINKYTTSIDADSLYDYADDPDNLHKAVEDGNQYSAYEKAISEAGYDGYFVDTGMGTVAAMFTPLDVDNDKPVASAANNSSSFWKDLADTHQYDPMRDKEMVLGKAAVDLWPAKDDTVHIVFIHSLEQGGGNASKALQYVTDLADKHNVELTLNAAPLPYKVSDKKAAFSKNELIEWYSRHGFKPAQRIRGEDDYMVRVPQSTQAADMNPNHDPADGEFTTASAGEKAGFNTAQVFYHGTTADFKSFKIGHKGGNQVNELGAGIYVDSDSSMADWSSRAEGGNIKQLYIKHGDIFDWTPFKRAGTTPNFIELSKRLKTQNAEMSDQQSMTAPADELWKTWLKEPDKDLAEQLKASYARGDLNTWLSRAGYVGAKDETSQYPTQVVVFDPKNIRSINAKFNPKKSDSKVITDEWNEALHPRGQPDNAGEFVAPATIKASSSFYVKTGAKEPVEVMRNPSDNDYRSMRKEAEEKYGKPSNGDPILRSTEDADGNKYFWTAYEGVHAWIEPLINTHEAVIVNQNASQKLSHRGVVRKALYEGKQVPSNVLKEYPNLVDEVKAISGNKFTQAQDFNPNHDPADGEFTTAGGGTKEAQNKLDSKGYPKSVHRAEVGTPEFKKWFSNSKVVDADGDPVIMYHGTHELFDTFHKRVGDIGMHFGTAGQATDRLEYLAERNPDLLKTKNFSIMPVYLKIVNPLRLPDLGLWNATNVAWKLNELFPNDNISDKANIWDKEKKKWYQTKVHLKSTKDIREFIQSKGYDGIVYLNDGEVSGARDLREASRWDNDKRAELIDYINDHAEDSYIAFESNQIKSALSNKGTFNPKSKIITDAAISYDEWNEALHPRGQPDNAGEFVEVAGGSTTSKYNKPQGTLPDISPLLVDSRQDSTPEAQAERRAIVINAFAKARPVVGRKPILYMMGGGGGAGKSMLLKKLQKTGDVPNEESGAVFVDPDAIKTSMKRYKDVFAAGDYRASMVVHEDSSAMSKDVLSAAKGAHYDVVFDATMSDHDKGMRRIAEFKAAGYEVRMFNVTTDPELAVERAMNRYKATGRYVDPAEITFAHKKFGEALPDYEKSVDYFRTYSNIEKLKLERASDKPQEKMQKRPVTAGRKILFEVAPNPKDKELSARWNIMDDTARSAVSTQVLHEVLPEVLQKIGVHASMRMQYGGYGDDTNPSVSLALGKGTTDEQADRLTRSLGSILQQDSMARVSEKPFKGSYESGAVFVKVPKNISGNAVRIMYNKLRSNVLDASGKPLITGHTTDAGVMTILVDKGTEEQIHNTVLSVLGDDYEVGHETLNVAWPEKGEDDYGFTGESKTVGTSTNAPLGAWVRDVRAKAEKLRDKGISSFGKEKTG